MAQPTLNGSTSTNATSVSFSLPYGTDLLVIFAGVHSTTSATPPSAATYNSVACTAGPSSNPSVGSQEAASAIFYMLYKDLPAPGSSYTAAVTGGVGANPWICAAAFGGLKQAGPTGTDSNLGPTLTVTISGVKYDLMVAMLAQDDIGSPTVGGAPDVTIANFSRFCAAYYLYPNTGSHGMTFSGGTWLSNDSSCGAVFAHHDTLGAIWM